MQATKRALPCLVAITFGFCAFVAPAFGADPTGPYGVVEAELSTTPIAAFHVGAPDERRFGRLRFSGGLVVRSDLNHAGAFSGLVVSGTNDLLAVTDTGFWLTARVERDENGIPKAFENGRMGPLLDVRGQPFTNKWNADAEGLTLRNGRAFVSTEQRGQLLAYPRGKNGDLDQAARVVVSKFPGEKLRNSFGLESLVAMPDGKLLAIAEGTPDDDEPARAFLIGVTGIEEMTVVRKDGFYITDATLLPESGDVLLLERNFTPARGPEMRLRVLPRDTISPGAVADGEILLTVGRGYVIDNMEGVEAFTDEAGETRIAIISDDNHWPLQRTLYLEFVLEPEG